MTTPSAVTKLLLAIVLLQWILFSYLLRLRSEEQRNSPSTSVSLGSQEDAFTMAVAKNTTATQQWEGVAIALMLKRPKWYCKRYNVLIHNALTNIPYTWAVQLFVFEHFFENAILDYHRGLRRLIQRHPRIVVTKLPPHLETKKPTPVLRDRWVWEHVVADRVLTFHGDGVLCANSERYWNDYDHLDYVGVPWDKLNGIGGDGTTHSLRSAKAMLAALDSPHRVKDVRHDTFLISTLLQINQHEGTNYKIASQQETEWFGGTHNLQMSNGTLDENWGPNVVTGTQADLSQQARNWMIGVCQEIKIIYPSLHHPSCFGARPNPQSCAASLGLPPPCVNTTTSTA